MNLYAENNPSYAVSLIPKVLLENAHTVVRQENYTVEIPSYDKIIVTHKKVVTLLNNNSGEQNLYCSYSSFSKINKMGGRIYDEDGKLVREIKKKEVEDYSAVSGGTMYGDSRVKVIEFSHPTYPFTVEYEYKETISKIMFYPFWQIQNYGVAVENAVFTVKTKDIENLNYKELNTELSPTTTTDKGETTLTWEVVKKPAIKKVNYCPTFNEVLPMVLLSPNKFKLGNYNGRMDSWKDFGIFMNELNYGRDILSKSMTKEVQELTASAKSDREKAEILYKYLQEHTRYISVQIGVGGWQTFDADYVEKNKYGDCKALTHFMKAMLSAVGVKSYPVLINRYREGDLIFEDFVCPSFNHVLLKLASEDYFLECTSTYSPPNYLGNGNDNRTALLIKESGGELIETPEINSEDNKEKNTATITLLENGDANITNKCILTGVLQDQIRYKSFERSQEEMEKDFIKDCGLPSAFIKNYNVKPLLEDPEVQIDYNVNVIKYAVKSGKRFFIPINPINAFTTVPDKEERKERIEFRRGYMLEDDLTLLLPEGYEIESIPEEKILLESDYGIYTLELTAEASKLTYKRTLKMLPLSLPASAYEDFRAFRKKVADLDNAKLVLVKKRT